VKVATKHFLAAGVSTLGLMAGAAQADIIHADDVIINGGSLCVGLDCINGQGFGDTTILLKENNTRILFEDTSATGSFPSSDWQLRANDSADGGAEKFTIGDVDNGTQPFTVQKGAGSNALFVEAGGDVGFGTSNPVVDLHSVDGNTPTLRLEQDGSSGFAAQTWDVAGNETNFFIRDVTNGSTLPFRILPGASSQSLVIDGDNNVGIGTASPDAALHVNRATGGPAELLRLTNNAGGYIGLEDASVAAGDNTGRIWNIQNIAGEYRITTAPGGGAEKELVLDADGNLTINGTITTSGSCSAGCDRVFDADYDLPSITEQREMMFANRHLPNVGPTAESGPMNLSDKIGGMLNELEKAHIYIGELHNRIEKLEAQINKG